MTANISVAVLSVYSFYEVGEISESNFTQKRNVQQFHLHIYAANLKDFLYLKKTVPPHEYISL